MRGSGKETGREHHFGGDWTTAKLDAVSSYLAAYTTALKKQRFKTAYIDGFAGTGYRTLRQEEAEDGLLFPDLAQGDAPALLDGSARQALRVEPRFDSYIFIEKHRTRCETLQHLRREFPGLDISILQGEANAEIRDLCSTDWTRHRAVLFLDPYGMQVEWPTIEAVARTGAIDLWLLFPLGIGVNRLLPRTGQIPEAWRRRLDILLGRTDWYSAFYREEKSLNLFGEEETMVAKRNVETIRDYFIDRLQSVFPGVATPRVLVNSVGCPLYLLCFAVSSRNQRAHGIALRIANHLLARV